MSRSPRYLDLADRLEQRWRELAPGTLVESEHHLAAEFDVNRLTAREALRELERRMVVRRVVGRGTFTAHRLDYVVRLGGIASFHRNVEAAGHVATTVVSGRRWLGRGATRRLEISRASTVDGFAASSTIEWFPAEVARLVDVSIDDGSSVHDVLSSLGFVPRRHSVRVDLAIPPADHADALDFSSSVMPSWHLVSQTIDVATSEVIHGSSSWMRSDMFAVTVIVEDNDSDDA